MRNLFRLFAFLFVCGAALAAPNYLARVELAQGRTAADAAKLGATVVADVGAFCLVNGPDEQLAVLNAAGYEVKVLDQTGDVDHYFVRAAAGFDRSRLEECGRVLDRYSRGYIVAATDEGVAGLNRLPVELRRVPRAPIVLSDADQLMPVLPLVDDSLVRLLVDRVNADSVLEAIRRLQNFYTRYSTTDSLRRACEWMRAKLVEYGCDSTALDTWSSMYAPNVVGYKFGRRNRDTTYVIDGHIDNTSDYEPNHCPGADDNASGTTAVIEAARVFADMEFDNTIVFIGFTGEEQGLLGSEVWARDAKQRGDKIRGVLNFDMISYGRQTRDSFEVIGKQSNPNCAWLMDFYIAQADTFSTLKTVRIMDPTAEYSDHASFWTQGYVAFCGIEDDFTPEYHTLGDTIGTLYYRYCGTNNWPMATEAIKAAVASLAKLAGARPESTAVAENPKPRLPRRELSVTPSVGRAPFRVLSSGAVSVYDATGRVVRSLPAGMAAWDGLLASGAKAGAGVYLLHQDNADQTARLVLTD